MKFFKKVIIFIFLVISYFPNTYAEKIAVISDVHGNMQALLAVIEDIEKQKVDKIICLGDIVSKGPDSDLTLELARKKVNVMIMGNCDINVVVNGDPEDTEFANHQLDKKQKYFLMKLPLCYDMKISGRNVRFFHASPTDLNMKVNRGDNLSSYSDLKYRLAMFENTEFLGKTKDDPIPDIVVYGHIHTQLMQKIAGRTLISVGSAGNSVDYETYLNSKRKDDEKISYVFQEKRAKIVTQANYIIIEGDIDSEEVGNFTVSFKEVNYDINAAVQSALNKKDYPHTDIYINEITKGGNF